MRNMIVPKDKVEAMLNRIQAWDFTKARKQYIAGYKREVSTEEFQVLEREYARYIALNALFPTLRFSLSRIVDDFWHAHILCTQDYAAFCGHLGCGFIHHNPEDNQEMLKDSYANRTMPLYEQLFGPADPAYWPQGKASAMCNCDNGCQLVFEGQTKIDHCEGGGPSDCGSGPGEGIFSEVGGCHGFCHPADKALEQARGLGSPLS